MSAKLWQTIFHVCWMLAAACLPTLAHNLSVNDGTASMLAQILGIWGTGAGSLVGVVGTLIGHHKVSSLKAAAMPPAASADLTDRSKLIDLLWTTIGVAATDDEIKAIKALSK